MNIDKKNIYIWNRQYKIPKDLIEFILPIVDQYYGTFDGGHAQTHAYQVINRGLKYSKEYSKIHKVPINYKLIFVSCALHDIGMSVDRKMHHIHSGKIVRDKYYTQLKRWFTDKDIKIIIEAMEDHRNSLPGDPRSLYGRITSQADRNTPRTIKELIIRSILWGKKNLSTNEERYHNTMGILYNKYGTDRRIRLDLPSINKSYKKMDKLLSNKKRVSRTVKRYIKKYNK